MGQVCLNVVTGLVATWGHWDEAVHRHKGLKMAVSNTEESLAQNQGKTVVQAEVEGDSRRRFLRVAVPRRAYLILAVVPFPCLVDIRTDLARQWHQMR